MNTYKVYFQIYGRKMVVEVHAESFEGAEQEVLDAVKFDKVTFVKYDDDALDQLKNIFGMK